MRTKPIQAALLILVTITKQLTIFAGRCSKVEWVDDIDGIRD